MQPPDVAHRFRVAIQDRADKLLCAAGPASPGGPVPDHWAFQYVERPSVGDWTSRTVFTSPRTQQVFIRRHCWLRAKSFDLVAGRMAFVADQVPEPWIEVNEGVAPIQHWQRLYAEGSALSLPPLPPLDTPMGLDGTAHHIELRIGFAATKFVWWHDGPAAWSPLIEWVCGVVAWCNEVVVR